MADKLCVKCNKFFGNPQKLNMCSVCHKEYLKQQKIIQQVQKIKIPEIPQSKQADHSRCFACKKKIGLLGIRCKACDCSFCNVHRMPQNHKCQIQSYLATKNEIKKTTNITAPKIQQI